ncbi:MAG: permease-like cell division protein FtsX [Patescibacteria group bacterium]
MFVTTRRIVRFAFQNLFRNIWLALATVSIITLALLSVNFFVLANAFIDTSLTAIEKRINISVYFKPSGQESEFLTLADRLRALPQVDEATYVSKEEALEKLKAKYDTEKSSIVADSLKELDENPLTASLIVRAKSIDDYPPIEALLNEQQYEQLIDKKEFDDRTLLIRKIKDIKERAAAVGYVINIFFAIIASLIVYNTIRITIYTRKREIGIMKLVGATNTFVRTPLLLEGVLYSIIAMGATLLLLYPLLGAIQPSVERFFDGQAFDVLGYFSSHAVEIFGMQLLASIALNIISSSMAIGRYLKV